MKLATWNVNSIRARRDRVLAWLSKEEPDVLCLQELKCTEKDFPFEVFGQQGYRCAVYGQKTYNGVAILSRRDLADVRRGMEDGVEDSEARLLCASIGGIHIVTVYVPNGRAVGSEPYYYKLQYLKRLRRYLQNHWSERDPVILCGDFNVAPGDSDVAYPELWSGTVLCHQEVRQALREVASWGLKDILRLHHPEGAQYTWWDYRFLSFPKNNGLRLDHIFATEALSKLSQAARVDREERKGKRPSDHAPVVAVFEL